MKIFDTHAHYDDEQFNIDRDELLNSMSANGVGYILNASATLQSVDDSIALAHKYDFVYAAIGIHPDEVGSLNEKSIAHVESLLLDDRCVAVGEIGLDYHWNVEEKEIQKKWFIYQIEMARKYNKPIIIHSRDASADTFNILKEYASDLKVIVHCYSYSKEQALEYVKMGYLIGVGGVVTFKNAKKIKEVVEAIPIGNIVLETDCPYLAPEPFRGKRNNSIYIHQIAEKVAELKGMTKEEIIDITTQNALLFYNVGK
ncbi:MAG: TatD family hydrolase [Lachnospiraceae bacterium]|jgi:TatD DNase family protein|nr:TatD family hydrolase [Lachnospiraceae bacterium]